MSGIHQILVSASPGDAITNMAFELRSLLRKIGPSEIYARHIAPALADEVFRLRDYHPRHAQNVLLFHASIGEPDVHAMLMSRREPLVLMYHNITPASFFERYDPDFADYLKLGRRELERLRPRVALAIAASRFNASELTEMGYDNVRVVPPVVDPYRLASLTPDPVTLHHLESNFEVPLILSVAQILPHKRPDFLVQAMHIASTYIGCNAFLFLVGHARMPRYADALFEQIRELNLSRVHFVGSVDDESLVAFYRAASLVVSASEHEGFGVPLLEAMTFDTPVLARGCAAIPETLDGAGLVVPPHEGPEFYAEAIVEALWNQRLCDELVARGRARVAAFGRAEIQRDLLKALLEVV